MHNTTTISALGLLSGGLDSQLAVRLLQRQGISVRTIVFDNPFYDIRAAVAAADALDVPLRIYDFTDEILGLIKHPPHGFGKCMNPCIDCHALMLKRAGELLAEEGCQFLFTGEVLNERPMSQTKRALNTVAADSDYADLILRPLSALRLPPVKPEREGWVNRDQLLGLEGRRRTPQFRLAAEFGLKSYPTPAGGCLLTEPNFCKRLKELQAHEGIDQRRYVMYLSVGRHFRLASGEKFIVGRDQADNERIEALISEDDCKLQLSDGRMGPTGILGTHTDEQTLHEAAGIFAFYAKCPQGDTCSIDVIHADTCIRSLMATSATQATIDACRIG